MTVFGKRTLNKAQTRLDILNAVYLLSQEESFRELKVTSIAKEIGITEVTFFNYFRKKEDVLKYMMGIWALELQVLQLQNPLSGEAAIRRIFKHTAEQLKKRSGLMASFIAYLVTNEIESKASEIEAADQFLLYPNMPELYEIRIPSGNEMLMQHLMEIEGIEDHNAILLHLASCFYGDVLIGHTAGLDIDALYTASLDLIFSER